MATLQVQLRREQLKVQSLEKDLEQKVHECTQGISLTVVVQQILMDVVLNYLVLNIYIVFHCFFFNLFSPQAKEVKDVTELCDELLLKVQKTGF